MSKTIEAKAVITAADKTGSVFDKLAKKIDGIAKSAKAFENIKPLSNIPRMGEDFEARIASIAKSSKQLAGIHRDWEKFQTNLRSGGMPKAEHYLRAVSEWKMATLNNLKDVRQNLDETEKHHKKFFASAGKWAMGAAGIGGGAYLASQAGRAGIKASADRGKEMARYSLGGLTDDEKHEAQAKADEVSSKFPSISRTEVLGHIRQLRGRLGDFHHALDNVETISKAQVVLGTLGHGDGAAEDLEKLVLGLESQGLGSNPAKFKSYTDAFVKAKSLFPDLRGADFQNYMRNANASKYGLSDEYLQTIVPTMMQHEGSHNFGTMQASAFSALIGKRQTDAAKLNMRSYGLLDNKDNLRDERGFISNPRQWAEDNLVPALSAKGVGMNEEHRGDVVKALTQMFSNRKVGEFFASMLVNRGIIDKDRELLKTASDTSGAAIARREDPYVAMGGLTTQLKDTAAAFIGMKPVIEAMNNATTSFSNIAKMFETGKVPENSNLGKGIATAKGWASWAEGVGAQDWHEINRRALMTGEQQELDKQIGQREAGHYGPKDELLRKLRLRKADLDLGLAASRSVSDMPPLFSEEELDRWQEMDREHRRGVVMSLIPGRNAGSSIPLPTADPRRPELSSMPPVQTFEGANVTANLTGSADVHGEVTGKFEVTVSSVFLSMVESVKQLSTTLKGQLNASNGPGSTGRSSPDAAAPATGFSGVP